MKSPGTYTAGGAAVGTAINPGLGTFIGGAIGYGADLLSGGSAPAASGGTPYGVNPAAYGGLPVNFGQGESAQTGSYADQYNATLQQMNSEIGALQQQKAQAAQGNTDPQWSQDSYWDAQIAAVQQKYMPQLQAYGQAYQQGQHQDQLQGLMGAAGAAQGRQAPQINQGAYLDGSGGGGGSYGQGAPQGGYGPAQPGSYGGPPPGSNVNPDGTINLNPAPQPGAVQSYGAPAGTGGVYGKTTSMGGQNAAGLVNQVTPGNPNVVNRGNDMANGPRTFDTAGQSSGQIAQGVIDRTVANNAAANPPPPAPDNPLYIDYQNQLAAREGQSQLVSQLQAAAAGNGPSAAQAQLQQGLDANIAQAQSMARSTRGGSGAQALANRTALMSGAQATQQTANQAAQLRAQEMQQAYGQLGSALQSQRGGDLASRNTSAGIATNNANLQQQQTGMNDAASQYYTSLYMSALAGDRDAQMRLQEMNSNNYNASQGYGIQASQVNSNNYWNQVGQTNKVVGAVANAAGTYGQTQGAQGAGSGGGGSGHYMGDGDYGDGYLHRSNPY